MIEKILDSAKRNGDSAEVFYVETESNKISFESGILKNIDKKNLCGISLRVIHEGRLGFSSTTDPERTNEIIGKARASSLFGKEARFEFPPMTEIPSVNTLDPTVEEYSPVEASQEGKRAVNALRETCPKGLTDVTLETSVTTVRIANTSGFDMSYRSTCFSHYVITKIIEGDSIIWIGDGGHYSTLTIKTEEYVKKIADLARKAETKAPGVSGNIPVIFTAQEIPSLIQSIELGINGRRLVKGDSPLVGREGQSVLGKLTLTDDPFITGAPGSRPFDDEGVPSQRTVLFKDGIFQSFLFDLDTAGDAGSSTTSNADRGMLSSPKIGTSNLVMSAGDSNLNEMILSIDEGVIIYGVLGGGQSNLITGDFALNIMLGFLIRNGEIAGRLVDTMVSGNVYNAFGAVSALGRDVLQVGTLFVPDIMFSELSITGK